MRHYLLALILIISVSITVIMPAWLDRTSSIWGVSDRVTGTSAEVSRLSEANKILEKKNRELIQSERALRKKNRELIQNERALKEKKKLIAEISQRIGRRTAIMAARNVAAAPVEAIPVIGTWVIIAVTNLEIYDACQTMKDLDIVKALAGNSDNVGNKKICSLKVPNKSEIFNSIKNSPAEAWAKISSFKVDLPSWKNIIDRHKLLWKMVQTIAPYWERFSKADQSEEKQSSGHDDAR